MKVGIINIGDEILIGQILNTNAQWMSQQMTNAGFEVKDCSVVADDQKDIKEAIDFILPQVDIVLMTGGLGPTKDDVTKKTLCEYFGTTLIYSEDVLKNIQDLWKDRPYPVNDLTKTQAWVPKECILIQNRVGTAPITCFEQEGKILVSLPGVPYEMKYAMENEIIPLLRSKYQKEEYLFKNILVKNFTESSLAMHLEDFENQLSPNIHLAYLPSPRIVKLRLFARGEKNKEEFDSQYKKLCSLLDNHIIANKDISVELLLSEQLRDLKLTLSTAESCTGGSIAEMITSIAGASDVFKGSVVAYNNDVKANVLGVSQDILNTKGAVQEDVVTQMALSAQKIFHTDCSIATSGIAGPTGGTAEIPVGAVWICTRVKDKSKSVYYQFGNYREANITSACNSAIIQLLEMLDAERNER